ncbi:MAG: ACP S-malonyltransferase [bacterium]
MKKIAIVFPGQGSQKVGMGKDLYEAIPDCKRLFDQSNDILKKELSDICFNGPKELLTHTSYAQPGLFVVATAIFNEIKKLPIDIRYLAGHSLGELTAYHASEVLNFEETLTVINKRAQAMANAYKETSGMTAVIGLEEKQIKDILKTCKECVVIANYNTPSQIVISGNKAGLEEAHPKLKEAKAKLIPLPVSGPFHSPLMTPASEELKKVTDNLCFNNARFPIILNKEAKPESQQNKLKENIPQQLIASVQWVKSIEFLKKECDTIIECGPGNVLSNLIKKIDPSIKTIPINTLESLVNFKKQIQ